MAQSPAKLPLGHRLRSAAPAPSAIRRPLLRWFDKTARDLPWRKTRDPYAIWISEIMLQQTRVQAAVPYYERFMRRFPTVRKLAGARIDSVLKLWEGLGYYSRARNLHKAAKAIVSRFDGRLPETREELLSLPGIGAYTAGAVASIAFGRREPLVDGNVTRVLCRVFHIREDPRQIEVQKRLWSIAEGLLPISRPGDFNQALMELGSEVCLPRMPQCDACPLRRACLAHLHKEQATLPVPRQRKSIPCHTVVVGVIERNGRLLIDKRRSEGLLGGLWEFPGGKKRPDESLEEALRREVLEEIGIGIRVEEPIATVDHAYSHFRIRLHAFRCAYVSGTPRCLGCDDVKWVRPGDLGRYAFPAANKKIIRALRNAKRDAPKRS